MKFLMMTDEWPFEIIIANGFKSSWCVNFFVSFSAQRKRQVKLHVASFPVAYFSTLFSLEESDFILGD